MSFDHDSMTLLTAKDDMLKTRVNKLFGLKKMNDKFKNEMIYTMELKLQKQKYDFNIKTEQVFVLCT